MDQLNVNTDGWEIAVDRLILREHIGRGAFGSVWRALLGRSRGRPGNRTVAAKCYLRKYFFFCLSFIQSLIKLSFINFLCFILIESIFLKTRFIKLFDT